MKTKRSGLFGRIGSFGFAFSGLYELIRSEPNAQIHLAATILAILAGFVLRISASEWLIIVIVIALVWAAEGFNTVVERLVDHLFQEQHETARIAKDISAGAVLVCAIAAAICGMIIFVPKIMVLLFQ